MYKLTLSKSERDAFDWVCDRYASSGDEMMNLIREGEPAELLTDAGEEADSPDECGDIEYLIPEHVAWQMNDLAEQEDYMFPCFSTELTRKMIDFCMQIV